MTNLEHINSLRNHGAQIKAGDTLVELTTAFYEKAVAGCREGGYNAVTYDLVLPGIEDPMMLAVWKDGHVDSGSVKKIAVCLEGFTYARYVACILESKREKDVLTDTLRMATLEEILDFAETGFQPFPAWIELNPRYNDTEYARRNLVRPVAVERCDRLSDPDPELYTSHGNFSLGSYRKGWRLWYADGMTRPDTTTEWLPFSWDRNPYGECVCHVNHQPFIAQCSILHRQTQADAGKTIRFITGKEVSECPQGPAG